MNINDATEQAYKNGYEAGMNEAVKQGYARRTEQQALTVRELKRQLEQYNDDDTVFVKGQLLEIRKAK